MNDTRTVSDPVEFCVQDGRITVSLRWPGPYDAPCACHDTLDGHLAEVSGRPQPPAGPLFAELVSPVWWVEVAGCVHHPGCGCGLAGLAEAYAALTDPSARQACVDAGVALLRELIDHRRTAAGGEQVRCAGCVLDVDRHFDVLDDAVATLSLDLGEVVGADTALRVGHL